MIWISKNALKFRALYFCNCLSRLDLFVENEIAIEIKSVSEIQAIHKAQLLTYLKLRAGGIGLLINFNVYLLKEGICRLRV